MRFYFYRNGQEIKHKLNGAKATGTGAWVQVNGEYRKGYKTQITIGKGGSETNITCSEFNNKPVLVKHWFPNPKETEIFWLVPEGYDISKLKKPSWNLVRQ